MQVLYIQTPQGTERGKHMGTIILHAPHLTLLSIHTLWDIESGQHTSTIILHAACLMLNTPTC